MGLFDTVTCDYPLPDPRHQDLEFQTKDLEKVLGHYTITRDGRLIRHAQPSPFVPAPVSDVEWPIHGDIRIYERDPDSDHGLVEYAVRFTYGRVDWIRRVRLEGGTPSKAMPIAAEARQARAPEVMGRPLTPEEFMALAPEKLELVDGRIPGDEKLVMLLLASLGLRRVAALVGREAADLLRSVDESRRATLLLRLLAQGEADVRGGRVVPQEQVFREVRAGLARKIATCACPLREILSVGLRFGLRAELVGRSRGRYSQAGSLNEPIRVLKSKSCRPSPSSATAAVSGERRPVFPQLPVEPSDPAHPPSGHVQVARRPARPGDSRPG